MKRLVPQTCKKGFRGTGFHEATVRRASVRRALVCPVLSHALARLPAILLPVVTLAVALSAVALPAITLPTAAAAQTDDIPRTASGKPDLNGVWQVMNRANFDLLSHSAQPAMAMAEGPFGPVPAPQVLALGAVGAVPAGLGVVDGDEIPYTAEGRAKQQENQANWLDRDPEIRCYLPGVPRATYMPFPFQIFQSDSALLITYEYAGAVRNLHLQDPGEAPIDSWMGQSWARWEGDTLVVESSGFNDQTWFDRAGNHHSEMLRVTEQFTLINPHVIEYVATITDEKTFTRPWTMRMPIYKRVGADAQLLQFKCVEFVEELLYGKLRDKPLYPAGPGAAEADSDNPRPATERSP